MASQRKTHLRGTAQPGAQLVQLEMREMEMAEEALVQGVRVPTCTSEPPRNRGLSKALRPARLRKDRALRPEPRAPRRPGARGVSGETRGCCGGGFKGRWAPGPLNH